MAEEELLVSSLKSEYLASNTTTITRTTTFSTILDNFSEFSSCDEKCVNSEIHVLSYHAPERGSFRTSADSASVGFAGGNEFDDINAWGLFWAKLD